MFLNWTSLTKLCSKKRKLNIETFIKVPPLPIKVWTCFPKEQLVGNLCCCVELQEAKVCRRTFWCAKMSLFLLTQTSPVHIHFIQSGQRKDCLGKTNKTQLQGSLPSSSLSQKMPSLFSNKCKLKREMKSEKVKANSVNLQHPLSGVGLQLGLKEMLGWFSIVTLQTLQS